MDKQLTFPERRTDLIAGDGKQTFRISVNPLYEYDTSSNRSESSIVIDGVPSLSQISDFASNGYAVFPQVLTKESVMALNHQLELVLRGQYNTGSCPDKTPKLIKTPLHIHQYSSNSSYQTQTSGASTIDNNNDNDSCPKKCCAVSGEDAKYALGYSGNKRKKVLQIINIHKSDTLFRDLVTIPLLGRLVAKLMQWEDGARLCQDQIWAK